MSITGARHIGLNVTDLDYAVSWYTSTLGVGFQEWPNGHVETTKNLSYDVMVANEGGGRLLAHPTTG
ncbi:hypothetical protein NL460_28375, partial [Klebsiella pneumoniae]|nr:hypothetical protein [Klebsiella pneumoniae]